MRALPSSRFFTGAGLTERERHIGGETRVPTQANRHRGHRVQQKPPRNVNENAAYVLFQPLSEHFSAPCVADQQRRWTPEAPLKRNLFSDLSLSALILKRKCVHHVRRLSTQWRDWWPTTWSSIQHASVASTARPNSALAASQLFKVNFTANPTSSSCSRRRATTTRASDANSTKSFGPPRSRRI